jgi:hypothetical protein
LIGHWVILSKPNANRAIDEYSFDKRYTVIDRIDFILESFDGTLFSEIDKILVHFVVVFLSIW